MKIKPVLALLAVALLLPAVNALEIESKSYDFQIVGSSVYVEEEILFGGSVSGLFNIPVPDDAEGISFYVDSLPVEYSNQARLSSAKEIRINYITRRVLDKGNFLANIKSYYNITSLDVSLALDEGASIMKEKEGGLSSPSVFPEPDEILSDGHAIILKWSKERFSAEESFPIYVRIKRRGSSAGIIFALAVLALVGYAAVTQFLKTSKKQNERFEEVEVIEVRKEEKPEHKKDAEPKEETKKEKEEAKEERAHDVLGHLKPDEQQIARILKSREGACEQGTLRIVTGFSKAQLSRLLSELESRNIVKKEKRGKKNIVFLRE